MKPLRKQPQQEPRDLPDGYFHRDSDHSWVWSYAAVATVLFGFFAVESGLVGGVSRTLVSEQLRGGAHVESASLAHRLRKEVQALPPLMDVDIKETSDGVELMFASTTLFDVGSAELLPEPEWAMNKLIEQIKSQMPGHKIVVEGHTDDRSILPDGEWASNWDLSAARAVAVVQLFESLGFPPADLSAVGYGSSRPLKPNRNARREPIRENMDINRRVVIKVLAPR